MNSLRFSGRVAPEVRQTIEENTASGPPTAFPTAIEAHDRALFTLARRLCGNDADARDLVHDTYEKALRSKSHYTNSGSFRSWLLTILHNLFIDRCREARRIPRTDAIDEADVPAPEPTAPPIWANMTTEHISRALAKISPEFRCVYTYHLVGVPHDVIAAELGIARTTVRTRLARARNKLKQVLERDLADLA